MSPDGDGRKAHGAARLIAAALDDAEAGWSLGSFGAIAEFTREPDETVELHEHARGGAVVTALGGIAVSCPDDTRAFAYEGLSKAPERWSQGVVFCRPDRKASRRERDRIEELGPDGDALRPADRGAILFDLGIGAHNVSACIRTGDASLIAALRRAAGTSLLDPANKAMGAIQDAHPHRVFLSDLGRIEVYQVIGSRAEGAVTPEGPHTHVLPQFLKSDRTHSANVPVPDGFTPCLTLHPANPLCDQMGQPVPFDAGRFARFQEVLRRFPPTEDYLAEKARIAEAVGRGPPPARYEPGGSRAARRGARVMLRQLAQTGGDREVLAAWRARFDAATDE